MRRRIQEVEVDEVVDTQRLKQQDDVAQVDALNLRHGVFFQLVLIGPGGVQPEALASRHSASTSGSLIGRRF